MEMKVTATLLKCLKPLRPIQVSNSSEREFYKALTSIMSSCRCCRRASRSCTKLFNKTHKPSWRYFWVAGFLVLEQELEQEQVECPREVTVIMAKVLEGRELFKLHNLRWKRFRDSNRLDSRRDALLKPTSLVTKMKNLLPTFCLNQSLKRKNLLCRKELQTLKV